ncbi:MAG: endonuclease/exonuclease/phosphatase family protein [Geminicoccaceae bacterium]
MAVEQGVLKLVTYNIHYGHGQDGCIDLVRIAEAVRGADIIGLQEVDRFWQRTGMVDQALSLAELLPGYVWIYGPGYDAPAQGSHPESDSAEQRGRRRQHGNMILSRWPILSSRVMPLPKARPSQFCQLRVLLEAVIIPPGGAMRVVCTHLCHISSATRLPQVEQLHRYRRMLQQEGATWSGDDLDGHAWADGEDPPPCPHDIVIMGDLNMTPDSEEYRRLVGNDSGLEDSWAALGHDPAAPEAWSCISLKDRRKLRLDYITVSSGLTERLKNTWIDQKCQASDHCPLWLKMG